MKGGIDSNLIMSWSRPVRVVYNVPFSRNLYKNMSKLNPDLV